LHHIIIEEFAFQLSWLTYYLFAHSPIQPSSRNINHERKNVNGGWELLMAVKKAAGRLKCAGNGIEVSFRQKEKS